jgi:glutamate formiminotransferase
MMEGALGESGANPGQMRLEGKVAMVTGGAFGIGRAIARRLSGEGASVALIDLEREAVLEAAFRGAAEAASRIDLTRHTGEHPRMGAVDVIPFIPISGATTADCVALARRLGQRIGSEIGMPVYLYEEAATRLDRKNLADVRRGEFEGLTAKMAQPDWHPDFGPALPHPSAGASVIGARMPLIAYNVNLATDRLDVAKKIAAAIRFSSGGLRFVKAMGLALAARGIVQVSINLTNYEKTPVFRVFETVKREAARYGVAVLESEIVGLVPAAAIDEAPRRRLKLAGFDERQILENRLSSL